MQYKREINGKLQSLCKKFPVIALTGARQVGKTTLLKEAFPKHNYISLDLPSLAEFAENDASSFLAKYKAPLVIDEIQYAPKLFRALKEKVDHDRHKMGQYILTGSQKFPLMKEASESLAGRIGLLELETLSLQEVGEQKKWSQILSRGMYPELWRQPELEPGEFFSSYLATYLERDVRQILNIGSLRDFERFLRSLASRSGQLLNRTDIARDVGVASKTIGEWISVLQASNQVFVLEPYFENLNKRLAKSPKVYFHDTGLLCFLLGLDEGSVDKSPLVGAIWETFVYSELRKRSLSTGSLLQTLWYYRDAQGKEVDFLRSLKGEIDLFECKWSESPDKKWLALLTEIHDQIGKSKSVRPGKQFIVCRTGVAHRNGTCNIINPNQL